MDIRKTLNGSALTIALSGRLDTTSAPELENVLNSSLVGVEELNFELEDLEYISSAGLRIFLTTQKRMNKQGKMIIRNAGEAVKEVFDMTGFSDFLTIEE